MPKHISYDAYIKKAQTAHNNRYDYTLIKPPLTSVMYVVIGCGVHGTFKQQFASHLRGNGCPRCNWANKKSQRIKRLIAESVKIHGSKYDYSLVSYTNARVPVTIVCKKHGAFQMRIDNHVYGKQGCPLCGSGKKRTTQDFITLAKEVHGDRFDYSKVVYKSATTKVDVICREHGVFSITPDMHCFSNRQGCSQCVASTGERLIYKTLKDMGIHNFICEHKFNDCFAPDTKYSLWFDFYLPELNVLIEYDGQSHFEEVNFSGKLSSSKMKQRLNRVKYLDKIKDNYAASKNIKLIRIPYTTFNNIENILRENLI